MAHQSLYRIHRPATFADVVGQEQVTKPLEEAAKKIKKFKFHRLPVVKNSEVVGLITIRDILSFYPELNAEFREIDSIKEETEKLKRLESAKERVVVEDGICEECGGRGALYRENGILICASCSSSL